MHSTALSETSWLRARFKLFVFYWKKNVIFHWLITINIYMLNICVVFHVKCEEWQVGCHRLFGGLYRCNFHFNLICIIVIFNLFLKYDVNLVYLVIYLRRINWRRFVLFVTYTIIQSITSSEMCSLHLTHPSTHTWSSGQPTLRRPGSSRGFGALLKGLISRFEPTTSAYKFDTLSIRQRLPQTDQTSAGRLVL